MAQHHKAILPSILLFLLFTSLEFLQASAFDVPAVSDDDFYQTVLDSDLPVMVIFWAEFCEPCKLMRPVFDEVAELYVGQLKSYTLNVNSNPKTPTRYGIRGLPTTLFFDNGVLIYQFVGAVSKRRLVKIIDTILGVDASIMPL